MCICGLIMYRIIDKGIHNVGQGANNVKVRNHFFVDSPNQNFSVNFKEKQKENQLVDIVNDYIMPSISVVREKLKVVVVLDQNTQ